MHRNELKKEIKEYVNSNGTAFISILHIIIEICREKAKECKGVNDEMFELWARRHNGLLSKFMSMFPQW